MNKKSVFCLHSVVHSTTDAAAMNPFNGSNIKCRFEQKSYDDDDGLDGISILNRETGLNRFMLSTGSLK